MFIKERNIIRIKVLENKEGKKINSIEISKKKIEIARSTIIHNE